MKKMMMMKQQQQQQQQQSFLEENVSNLTCASGDTSVSNSSVFPPLIQAQLPKKKRSLPGNPDPDSEVIALSPKSLMATNRFVCEVCNKGFQRDQNLQLHRRGHNLPWKLKLKSSKEMKKKVYVCPEVGCVHHDPSRALGDLTGIKKHFCRKHGEKKWKCEKCSKRYAVQSDWKAHSKTCGTREYRCDCGTPFSRRDSFITHRAFCDILAEANAKAITENAIFLKKEEQQERPEIPPWLACNIIMEENQNQNPRNYGVGPTNHETNSEAAHMSATALLQKAAQMSANMNKNYSLSSLIGAHQGSHVSGFGLNLSSCDHEEMGMMMTDHNQNHQNQNLYIPSSSSCGGLFQEMMNSSSVSGNGFDGGSSIEDAFNGILGSNNNNYHHNHHPHHHHGIIHGDINGDDHSMTRDFLGLSQADVLSINGGLGQNQTSWQA